MPETGQGEQNMLTILIVDDEKLERRGIRFLLEQREEEFEILEAPNGKAACDILMKRSVDILFTDIKMPYMDGIELVKRARELCPRIEMVIFSGYGEFEYARQAMQAGVESYVLKPVDPKEFQATISKLAEHIGKREEQEQRNRENQDFRNEYFLKRYLYQGNQEYLQRISDKVSVEDWNRIRGLILIESEDNFFEESEEAFIRKLSGEVHQRMMFLNQGQRQELCVLCDSCDLAVLAQHICEWINRVFGEKFYVAAGSPIAGCGELPGAFQKLELLMENKFYQKDRRLFLPGKTPEEVSADQFLDDILRRMTENIRQDDMVHLWEHFQILRANLGNLSQYSLIYTKFMFSNLIREFYVHLDIGGKRLQAAIQQVYEFRSVQEVAEMIESLIADMERHMEDQGSASRDEVARAKSYIYAHYGEDISVETLADLVYLSPGYFSYIFKKKTGENVSHFIRACRMEKAKELLTQTNKKIVQICEETGFSNVSYFCRSFREYCGCSPEKYRKGEAFGEQGEGKIL